MFFKYGVNHCTRGARYNDEKKNLIWGVWGTVRTKIQMEQFMRFVKFSETLMCIDNSGPWFCFINNTPTFHNCTISRHFGHEYQLPR